MIEQIRQSLLIQIQHLTADDKPLSYVYGRLTNSPEGYPCAMIHFDTVDSQRKDSCHRERVYRFGIFVMQEITNASRDEATRRVEESIDEIIHALEKKSDLDGLVSDISSISGEVGEYSKGADGEHIGGFVRLEVKSLHNYRI